ncbi:exosortase A [Aestuariibacter halophilus]|uniref:Exosortase A n=1 Tax=Fluctibacter halophilus TaxID=226011 RepID=A0ABS8G2P9_9ALTE|nr:exosortase A [Aestuariibacter halophilus]MCC2614857.1 exosortase A [Aestuariibacter halophilus]
MFYQTAHFRLLLWTFLAWLGLFFTSIESTVSIWYRSETFTHCFIILPICIYLIKLRWRELIERKISHSYSALGLLIGVLLVWQFGVISEISVFEQAAAFSVLPLSIWFICGREVARVILFPLVFWMFSVPVGEFLIPDLQDLTADITVWALQMSSIPVYREGLYIAVPGGLFEVAVACSGIRYLIASFTLGTLYAYLNYTSLKKRTIFILFSIILPLIANGIRAYGIVIIAYLSDMQYAVGVDHLIYGWVFFGVVILMMFSIGSIWADEVKEQRNEGVSNTTKELPIHSVLSLTALIILSFSAGKYERVVEPPETNWVFNEMWRYTALEEGKAETWQPVFKGADQFRLGFKQGIYFYSASYRGEESGKEMISSTNHIFDRNYWILVKRTPFEKFELLELINSEEKKVAVAYGYATQWIISPDEWKVKLIQAVQAFLGEPQRGVLIAIGLPLDSDGDIEKLLLEANRVFTKDLIMSVRQ